MKKKHFGLKSLTAIFLILGMLLAVGSSVFAAEANQKVKDDRNGVVQVVFSYKDKESGNEVYAQIGTGFLVGTEDTSTTLITNQHVTNLPDRYYTFLKELYPNAKRDDVTLGVIVKADVYIGAKYVQGSEKYDFAILELDQPINTRTPLVLASDDYMNDVVTQPVWALGFPSITSDDYNPFEDNPVYTADQVTVTSGTVSQQTSKDGCKYVVHNVDLDNGSSGGPLVDENGVVIGVNCKGAYANFGNYNASVDIREITDIMKMLDIPFTPSDGSIDKKTISPKEKLSALVEDAKKIDLTLYDDASVEVLNGAIKDAEAILDKEGASDDDYTKAYDTLKAAKDGLVARPEGMPMWVWFAIGGGVLLIAAVVVIIIVVSKKKKKAASMGEYEDDGYTSVSSNYTEVGNAASTQAAAPTAVLDQGASVTTVLGGNEALPLAYLDRRSTGQGVQITKSEFKIGREKSKVDYCVTDNSSIGRHHATVIYRGGRFYLKDNNSTNGTYVNEGKVNGGQEVELKNNDRIKFSNEEFTFRG